MSQYPSWSSVVALLSLMLLLYYNARTIRKDCECRILMLEKRIEKLEEQLNIKKNE